MPGFLFLIELGFLLACLFFMPRAKRVLQSTYPYHVTLRSINKMPFEMKMGQMWKASSQLLNHCSQSFSVQIHSFVLMPNHYHMIVRTPLANISTFMCYFNRELSREIGYETGRINQKFGARYHSSIIGSLIYYRTVYRYVYRNPVAASICRRAEVYPYSTLPCLLGWESAGFPIFDTQFEHIQDWRYQLAWLNEPCTTEEVNKIKYGLKKVHFSLEVPGTSRETSQI